MPYRSTLPLWDRYLVASKDDAKEKVMERALPLGAWWVPGEIELDAERDRLLWSHGFHQRAATMEEGLLTDFVSLAGSGGGPAILEYARRWGVLGICEHGLPNDHAGHTGRCMQQAIDGGHPTEGPFAEPLSAWRTLARRVQTIITLAALLDRGEDGTLADWAIALGLDMWHLGLWPGDTGSDLPGWTSSPEVLARAVQELLRLGNVRPLFRWKGGRDYGVELGTGPSVSGEPPVSPGLTYGLFGAIATQLAFMLSRSDGLVICSGCGKAFSARDSRAKPGANRYCRQCREEKIDVRARVKRSRDKKREAEKAKAAATD